MRIDVITLFPEMFDAIIDFGITRRAIERGIVDVQTWNPRKFTDDRHRTVDDRPYGGGPGMLMMAEPLSKTIAEVRRQSPQAKLVYLSPQGRQLDHQTVQELSARDSLMLLAGRYEGIDERLIEQEVDEEYTIGDFVLSGGELPAMVMIDAITRQIPGALGDQDSAAEDSFVDGLLDTPHYTRPETWNGRKVPRVLLSGDHEAIRRWRLKQALGRTWLRRPDLLAQRQLSDQESVLLDEFRNEQEQEK